MAMRQWRTHELPEADQFSYWREVICSSFVPLRPERLRTTLGARHFNCALSSWQANDVMFSKVCGDGQLVYRDARSITEQDEPLYFLNIQRRGSSIIEQGGSQACLVPGSFALLDAMQPFRMQVDDGFEHLSIKIPHARLDPLLNHRAGALARRIDTSRGVGRLASDAFAAIANELDILDSQATGVAIEHALALTACALNQLAVPLSCANSALNRLRAQAIAYLSSRLDDPTLDIQQTAAALGVSVRYVQGAFSAGQLSVGKWLLDQRLERCRHELGLPANANKTIASIALSSGFNDLSHFTRAFGKKFGVSPGRCRS
jgi:AraC family transcriptional regulator, positive regulator of tynA and feaB